MNASTQHRLPGLEPDNMLAFMALLGLLRALEKARPLWRPRVYWDVRNPPMCAVLVLSDQTKEVDVCNAAAEGCSSLAQHYRFNGTRSPDWPAEAARKMLQEAQQNGPKARDRADLLCALMSDGAVKENEAVIPTPMCLLFGQGHQYFLNRLEAVPQQESAAPRNKGKRLVALTPGETIATALFQRWERVDATPAFRWDPSEDRRYALRFDDPSKDAATTVHGANRLAAIGLPILTVAPVVSRGRVRLAMIGASYNSRRQIQITWPICNCPTSLARLRALLTHPLLHADQPDHTRLRALGVHELRRATRISVGKFLNFTRAAAL